MMACRVGMDPYGGAMSTPALALEGLNLAQGTLPSVAALETLLKG